MDLKTPRMQDVIDALDGGSGVAYLQICTSAYALVLATIPLLKPSWTLSAGVLSMRGCPLSTSSADHGGTAAAARFMDSDGKVWIQNLIVGVGTGDIQLNALGIIAGQIITLTMGTISHSP